MKRILTILLAATLTVLSAAAQERIVIKGTVKSSIEGVTMGDTRIYAFSTVGVGKHEHDRIMAAYEDGSYVPEYPCVEERPKADGTYEISVPRNGYLIFYKFPCVPVCVSLHGKDLIDVVIDTAPCKDVAPVKKQPNKKKNRKDRKNR